MKITGPDFDVRRINLIAKFNVTAVLPAPDQLQFVYGEDKFDVPFDIAQKMFNTKGKKLLKTNLSVKFNTDNEGEVHFDAKVLEVFDYGEFKYAKVEYNGQQFYVVDRDYAQGDTITVCLDFNDALITDEDLDIILVGSEPRKLQRIENTLDTIDNTIAIIIIGKNPFKSLANFFSVNPKFFGFSAGPIP